MRTGNLYQTARFDVEEDILAAHKRPTTPAPPGALSDLVTQQEYERLDEDEIDDVLSPLFDNLLDDEDASCTISPATYDGLRQRLQ